jgi:hypothetical protein
MSGLFQQFQNALQQQSSQSSSSQAMQGGKKKSKAVRKPLRAAAKPKAKPKRLVNKQRAFHNKLMKQFGGFFEAISQAEGTSPSLYEKKEKYQTAPSAHSMAQPSSKEQLTINDMVNAVPLSVVPLAGGRRYKKVAPKKAAPKKRPAVRRYRLTGGYEEEGAEEEFQSMDEEAFTTADSMIPLSTGGRKYRRTPVRRAPVRRTPVRRAPVRRASSPSSARRPRVRRV